MLCQFLKYWVVETYSLNWGSKIKLLHRYQRRHQRKSYGNHKFRAGHRPSGREKGPVFRGPLLYEITQCDGKLGRKVCKYLYFMIFKVFMYYDCKFKLFSVLGQFRGISLESIGRQPCGRSLLCYVMLPSLQITRSIGIEWLVEYLRQSKIGESD